MTTETSGKDSGEETDATYKGEEKPVVQFQRILDAQAQHGPIFRRELFDFAYAAYQAINYDEAKEALPDGDVSPFLSSKTTLLDIYGNKQEVLILREDTMKEHDGKILKGKRSWQYSGLQHLSFNSFRQHDHPLPYNFGLTYHPLDEKGCGENTHIIENAPQWNAEWESSAIHHSLVTHFKTHANTIQPIDSIICFGLGCMHTNDPRSNQRTYIQHLAALTIRTLLSSTQPSPPKIYAQDPEYCPSFTTYLSTHSITVLPDPEAFAALAGSSFVISISPNVPVRQLAVDLTYEDGGPAGMLCNMIADEGLGSEGKGMQVDEQGRNFFPYLTCESSPAVWAWKERCAGLEVDDGEEGDWFGRVGVYLRRRDGEEKA